MTIKEIEQLFNRVYEESDTSLEMLDKLSEHEEEYNKSELCLKSKKSIYDAFLFYFQTQLKYVNTIDYIQKVIDSLDFTKLNNNTSIESLFEEIPEEYKGVFKDLIESLSIASK